MSTASPAGPGAGPTSRSFGGRQVVVGAVILGLIMLGAGIGVGAAIWSGGSSTNVSAASNAAPPGNPPSSASKEAPNTKDYQTAATITWNNVPSGTRISFHPVTFGCALNPYGGSFTTSGSGFSNVINPFVADTSFGNGCLFKPSTGLWGVSMTGPGFSKQTNMSVFQVGPRTYSASCNGGGVGCVGIPRPLTGTVTIIVSA